jgi:hypothetical protein
LYVYRKSSKEWKWSSTDANEEDDYSSYKSPIYLLIQIYLGTYSERAESVSHSILEGFSICVKLDVNIKQARVFWKIVVGGMHISLI